MWSWNRRTSPVPISSAAARPMPLAATTARYSGMSPQRQKSSTNSPEPSAGAILMASGPGSAISRSTPSASCSTSSGARKPGRNTAPSRWNVGDLLGGRNLRGHQTFPGEPQMWSTFQPCHDVDLHQRRHRVAHARLEHVALVAQRELVDVGQLLVRVEPLDVAEQRHGPAPVVAVDDRDRDARLLLHVAENRFRLRSMFSRMCSPVHMYQAVAAWAEPSGRTVETMPGRRSLMKSITSCGMGAFGMAGSLGRVPAAGAPSACG